MKTNITSSGIKATVLTMLSIFLLTACEDPRRVSWSPDGSRAAVISGDGLRISDSDGKIGEPKTGVELVNWFSDSRHLLTVEYKKIDSWQAIQDNESVKDLRGVMETASKMLVEAQSNQGNMDKFGEAVKGLPYTREAVVYLRERRDKEMTASLGDKWTSAKNTVDVGLHEVCSYDVSDKTFSKRMRLYGTMRDVKELRLAPQGQAFLIVVKQETEDDTPYTLIHHSFDARWKDSGSIVLGMTSTISSAAAIYPDWAADGKAFYYVEADLPAKTAEPIDFYHTPLIGSLCSRSVDSEKGTVLNDKPKTHSRLIFRKNCKVRALRDGRVVFSAMPVQFPSGDSQLQSRQTLFVIRPQENVLVSPMVPLEALDPDADLVEFFELNPSGKMISIPSTKQGVFVYNVLTGDDTRVTGGGFSWVKRLPFVPSWRNEDELCLGLKEGNADEQNDKSDLVLWSSANGASRVLSSSWPVSAKKGFLEPKDKQDPAIK